MRYKPSLDCSKVVRYEKKEGMRYRHIVGLQERKEYLYKFISYNNFEDKEIKIPKGYKKVKVGRNWIKKLNVIKLRRF
jgi:hypothetical protein